MTDVQHTPTGDTNQPAPTELTDSKGNPINEDGSPREIVKDEQGGETVESLKKALADTKAELTKSQQAKAEETPKEPEGLEIKKEGSEETLDADTQAAKDAGVDVDAVAKEYTENGELSEETYKSLEAKGFDKATVDQYFEGRNAVATLQQNEIVETVGGSEKFTELQTWAAENLSADDLAVYNEAVVTSKAAAIFAVQAIQNKFIQANGNPPSLISGDTVTNNSGDVFRSHHEKQTAIEDPRYRTDPDYQKDVEAKVLRSIKSGSMKSK